MSIKIVYLENLDSSRIDEMIDYCYDNDLTFKNFSNQSHTDGNDKIFSVIEFEFEREEDAVFFSVKYK
jgi:hypothetical protein